LIVRIIAWFMGTRLGQYIAFAGLAAGVLGAALLRAFSAGKASEQAKASATTIENTRERAKIEASVDAASDGDVSRRLDRWVQHND